MAEESTLKNKASSLFDEDRELIALIPLHKWLLISASALIFVVLPLLFVWSSLGLIHTHPYGQGNMFADVGQDNKITSVFDNDRQ